MSQYVGLNRDELHIWRTMRLFCHRFFPVLQPRFDKLDRFVVNLANFLGLAPTVPEPVFVPVVDTA